MVVVYLGRCRYAGTVGADNIGKWLIEICCAVGWRLSVSWRGELDVAS